MYTRALVLLLASSALATEQAMPYKLAKKAVSPAQLFGLMGRQDGGYAPTQDICNGSGTTCPEACGPETVQCPSTDGGLHCFTPSDGQQCCPDGFGNACDDGYYCTDNADGTYCCPNGTSLTDCAALYSVSSLTSIAYSTTASSVASSTPTSAPASVSVATSSVIPTSSPAGVSTSSKATSVLAPTSTQIGGSNGTASTTSAPIFTGAANQVRGAVGALAMAAGAVLVL